MLKLTISQLGHLKNFQFNCRFTFYDKKQNFYSKFIGKVDENAQTIIPN